MNKVILTLAIIWIFWKVFKSVIEELQQRMQNPQAGDREKMLSDAARRSQTGPRRPKPASSREPDKWQSGQSTPGRREDELEKWYREALERKRQLSGAQPAGERMPREPARPRAAQPRAAQPRPAQQHVAPRVEHRREARVEQRRVARPREPVTHEPARERWEAPVAPPKPHEFRRALKRETRRRRGLAELVGAGEWDMDDIRRGIIIAEILGPPKALGDIDSHAI